MKSSLAELTLDNIGQWPKVIQVFVWSVLLIFLLGLGTCGFIRPHQKTYDRAMANLFQLNLEFEKKTRLAAHLERYKIQLHHVQERFKSMLTQRSSQNEMPRLLDEISKMGRATGLMVELFLPKKEVLHDFYRELPIQMVMVGTFPQLILFESKITQMNSLMIGRDFGVENRSESNIKNRPLSNDAKLRMTMTLSVYPELKPNRAFRYPQNKYQRSPFTPQLKSKESPERFSQKTLKLVGILQQGNTLWGLLRLPNGVVIHVRSGDEFGQPLIKVKEITERSMEVETRFFVHGEWKKRDMRLTFQ